MARGIYPRTKEYRKKMSESCKRGGVGKWMEGRKRSQETIKKFKISFRGHKVSEETRRKISIANKGRKLSVEQRENIRLSHLGLKQSKETIQKRINKTRGQRRSDEVKKKFSDLHKTGLFYKNYFKKGHIVTKGMREKISKGQMREKNPQWKGGIARLPYPYDFNKELKELIRKRDNYKCQECGAPQEEFTSKLPIHHIDYNKNNCDPKNLITLCRRCNTKANTNREYWKNYFNKKLEVII